MGRIKSYPEDEILQLKRVKEALDFANLRWKAVDPDRWLRAAKRITGKLAKSNRYVIDSRGKVIAKSEYGTKEARSAQRKLLEALDQIHRFQERFEGSDAAVSNQGSRIITVDFGKVEDVWIRGVVDGERTVPTTDTVVTPTINTWVAYAVGVMSRPQWINLIRRCTRCSQYYLTPRGRRGPKFKDCTRCRDRDRHLA